MKRRRTRGVRRRTHRIADRFQTALVCLVLIGVGDEDRRVAFEEPAEAAIVDSLRAACPEAISLVAVDENQVVGHILFSPAVLEGPDGPIIGMGLAPMAVLPGRQRQGIGSNLVRHGLDLLKVGGCPFVIVLGHPKYYPRFGFEIASHHRLHCQWEGVPDEAFMALVFNDAVMAGAQGVVRYRDEFDAAM